MTIIFDYCRVYFVFVCLFGPVYFREESSNHSLFPMAQNDSVLVGMGVCCENRSVGIHFSAS